MRVSLRLCLFLGVSFLGAAPRVWAQTDPAPGGRGTPAAEFVRANGTLDLAGAPAGVLNLAGLNVTMGAEGQLRAAAAGDYTNFSTGTTGGPNGAVRAVVVAPDGSVYIGGDFTQIGSTVVNGLARRPRGTTAWYGVWGVTGTVNALALSQDGGGGYLLYVGGSFTRASGAPSDNIARLDPNSGQLAPVGGGVDGPVNALAVAPDGSVYVGGSFQQTWPYSVNSSGPYPVITRWIPQTSTWSPVNYRMTGPVNALAVAPDGSIYVGGAFGGIGSVSSASRVARFTPSDSGWSLLGTAAANGVDNTVNALAVAADGSVYVGGAFTTAGAYTAGPVAASRVARWTPSSGWSGLGAAAANGVDNTVNALAVAADGSVYVGGAFTTASAATTSRVARWTGAAWAPLGSGVNGTVLAFALDLRADLILGGSFTAAGAVSSPYVTRYDAPVYGRIDGPAPRAYHMLAAPATGLTLADVLGPLWTQGFPGADYAGGAPSVYGYTEATPGDANAGYAAPASQSDAWAAGTGRFVIVYDDDDYSTPTVIDGGFPKRLAVSIGTPAEYQFTFPVSYTDDPSASAGDDGWNLLGNPFATEMNWDTAWIRPGLDAAVYVYDPSYLGGTYRTYVGGVGSLTNGVLPVLQGFWVHATATGAGLVGYQQDPRPAGRSTAGSPRRRRRQACSGSRSARAGRPAPRRSCPSRRRARSGSTPTTRTRSPLRGRST